MSPTTLLKNDHAGIDSSEASLDLDFQGEEENSESPPPAMVAPVVIPPRDRPEDDEVISPQRKRLLSHLLGMADMYARNGSLRQAIELYFELVNGHDGTDQALLASDRLMTIAQQYEGNRELRLARGIYERLLKVS